MTKHIFAAATCLCAVVLACSWQARTQTPQSGRLVLEAYVSAWNRHDFSALDKLLAADAIHEDIAQGFRGQGAAQIKDFMRGVIEGEPDLNWHVTTVVDAGPVVAAEWTWTCTFTGDSPSGPVVGKRISGRGASVAVIENGRIKRLTDYYDIASFFPKVPVGSTTPKTGWPIAGVTSRRARSGRERSGRTERY
jgi:steroid delta-isomerase-like uncharacterized protein